MPAAERIAAAGIGEPVDGGDGGTRSGAPMEQQTGLARRNHEMAGVVSRDCMLHLGDQPLIGDRPLGCLRSRSRGRSANATPAPAGRGRAGHARCPQARATRRLRSGRGRVVAAEGKSNEALRSSMSASTSSKRMSRRSTAGWARTGVWRPRCRYPGFVGSILAPHRRNGELGGGHAAPCALFIETANAFAIRLFLELAQNNINSSAQTQ